MSLSGPELVLAIVLAGWLVLSVLGQLQAGGRGRPFRHLRSLERAGIVPHYRLFLPRPDGRDHVLLIRARGRRVTTDWRIVSRAATRRWWHAVFNPASKRAQVVETLQTELRRDLADHALHLRNAGTATATATYPSLAYLALLNWATTQTDDRWPQLQFAIVAENAHGNDALDALSDWHERCP